MRWIALLMVILALCGCQKEAESPSRFTDYDDIIDSGKPLAMGDERDVYVFCDDANWKALKPFIQSSIEREVTLVYPEKYFNLIKAGINDVAKYSQYRNLVFIGDLSSDGKVSQHMRGTVAKDFINRVQQSGGDLFMAKNFASRDQITLYLMGSDPMNLEKIGALQSDNVFNLLLRRFTERLGYQTYQQKLIPAKFFEPYPFSLKIPDNYTLYSNDRAGNFLSFLYRARMQDREIPDKYISIYHEPMPENIITHEWLMEKRQMLGDKYFEGDEFDPEFIRKENTRLAGYDAHRIVGAWKNPKHLIGGAFQSYAFWHNGKAYIVDNSVYFPAGDKLPILVELYVISSSLSLQE
ncbi:MAG TPA: DUF4837 family protein [Candidatus Cloacimonadota bacterium]|nr:DUF4837 family protein [Candidatus Cloacimonadota bacterium]